MGLVISERKVEVAGFMAVTEVRNTSAETAIKASVTGLEMAEMAAGLQILKDQD